MSTRTTQVDHRLLTLVLPALTEVPEEILKEHLRHQERVHQTIREVLSCSRLGQIDQNDLRRFLHGKVQLQPAGIKLPRARLAKSEPIRQKFPNGWYLVVPEGLTLADLVENQDQFNSRFYNKWFLESYGPWPEKSVECLPTRACEIFIPDTADWLLPNSKGRTREQTLLLGEEFGRTLPQPWIWEEPTAETLALIAFAFHHQTGKYPLTGYNYARCQSRYKSGVRLHGGYFDDDGFFLSRWDDSADDVLGGLRWAVRYGRVGKSVN